MKPTLKRSFLCLSLSLLLFMSFSCSESSSRRRNRDTDGRNTSSSSKTSTKTSTVTPSKTDDDPIKQNDGGTTLSDDKNTDTLTDDKTQIDDNTIITDDSNLKDDDFDNHNDDTTIIDKDDTLSTQDDNNIGDSDNIQKKYYYSLSIKGNSSFIQYNDGLAGQTPNPFVLGIHKLYLMTSANDPNPAKLFDNGATTKEVDLLSETNLVTDELKNIPQGFYTHAKLLLTFIEETIEATGHVTFSMFGTMGSAPADISTVVAFNEVIRHNTLLNPDEIMFQGTVVTYVGAWPLPPIKQPLPPILPPGAITSVEGNEHWLIFPLPTPMPVIHGFLNRDFNITLILDVYKGFRWKDQNVNPSFSNDKFDIEYIVDADQLNPELVQQFGITNFNFDIK